MYYIKIKKLFRYKKTNLNKYIKKILKFNHKNF